DSALLRGGKHAKRDTDSNREHEREESQLEGRPNAPAESVSDGRIGASGVAEVESKRIAGPIEVPHEEWAIEAEFLAQEFFLFGSETFLSGHGFDLRAGEKVHHQEDAERHQYQDRHSKDEPTNHIGSERHDESESCGRGCFVCETLANLPPTNLMRQSSGSGGDSNLYAHAEGWARGGLRVTAHAPKLANDTS